MSKSESAPLMPVRTEQRGGGAAVQEAEQEHQLVEAAAPAAAACSRNGPNVVGQNAFPNAFRDPNGGKLAFL